MQVRQLRTGGSQHRVEDTEREDDAHKRELDRSQPESGIKDPIRNYLEQKGPTWNQVVPIFGKIDHKLHT